MNIFSHHDWREGRLILFGTFFNHAETPDNQKVQIPEAGEQTSQKEGTEEKDKIDSKDEDLEGLVDKHMAQQQKKAEEASVNLRRQVGATNERNKAIEDDVNAAKDATMIGLLTPDGKSIQDEALPIDSARVATLQNEAGAKVADNAAQERKEDELIKPESVEQGSGKNAA